MKIYLDDDLDWNALIGSLRQLGHEVISPRAAGTSGSDDADHLLHAVAFGCALLTGNARDFIQLHEEWMAQGRHHHGILIVYRENNPARDMTFQQIAQAVTKLEQAGIPLANAYHNLNFWR